MNNISLEEVIRYRDLRVKALAKGIDVEIGKNDYTNTCPDTKKINEDVGYAVIKHIASETFSIRKDGSLYLDFAWYNDTRCSTVHYRYSLDEVEKIVESYEESSIKIPKFYGFIRRYEDEPHYILNIQMSELKHFSEAYCIKYETIFGCSGGYEAVLNPTNLAEEYNLNGINNTIYSCENFFNDVTENNGILCITDSTRLDGAYFDWAEWLDIISINDIPYDNIMKYCKKPSENTNTYQNENNNLTGDTPEYLLQQQYESMLEQTQNNFYPF